MGTPARPARVTAIDLVAIFADVLSGIANGDSYGGTITYEYDPTDSLDGADWTVLAHYRIGNAAGQGGVRVIEGR